MATDLRIPMPGTPVDDPAWELFWGDLAERTGGSTDLVDAANTKADTAQTSADGAQTSADAAQSTADSAVASVASNAAAIAEIRFIEGIL